MNRVGSIPARTDKPNVLQWTLLIFAVLAFCFLDNTNEVVV